MTAPSEVHPGTAKKCAAPRLRKTGFLLAALLGMTWSSNLLNKLRRFDNQVDCCRQAAPVGGFLFKLGAPRSGQRIKPGLAAGLGFLPFGFDPGLLFQAVQRRVKRALMVLPNFI